MKAEKNLFSYLNSRKEQLIRGLIQVHITFDDPEEVGVAGESVWAYPIGNKYAQIANIPFFSKIGLDDIVETDESNNPVREFVAVVKQNTNTYFASSTDELTEQNWLKIRNYFLDKSIRIEGITGNLFAICAPVYLEDNFIDNLVKKCPLSISLYSDSDDIPQK